jgi:predicted transposase/invertase (TIGR01784 family)
MRHDGDNELLTDAIRVVYLELSKLNSIVKKSVSAMTDLEKWAVFFKYANDPAYRETVNEVIESKEVFKVAGELLMGISKDERERAVFRSRRMYQTDMASDFATVEDRGRAEGRLEGRTEGLLEGRTEGLLEGQAKGRTEGRTEGIIEVARNLIRMSIPFEQILSATHLSDNELERLLKEM